MNKQPEWKEFPIIYVMEQKKRQSSLSKYTDVTITFWNVS